MVSPLENPEERERFKHPQLLRWVTDERPRLLAAALTVLRGYHVAGRPFQNASSWGSFDEWSHLLRGALMWLGEKDPGLARGALDDASDSDKSVLAELLIKLVEVWMHNVRVGLLKQGVPEAQEVVTCSAYAAE